MESQKIFVSSIVIAHKLFPLITTRFCLLGFFSTIIKTVKLVPFRKYNISPFLAVSQ